MRLRGLLDKPSGHHSILVTDRDVGIRRELVSLLEPEGFSVFEASAGREAVELVRKSMVDILILNMLLPDVDGLKTLKLIRRFARPLPCIFIGERVSKEMRIKAMTAEAFAVLQEPFRPEVLKDTVWRLVYRYYGPPVS